MEVPEHVATIDFPEGDRYHGLEVRFSLDITLDEAVGLEQAEGDDRFKLLASYARGWNVTRKGRPVPMDVEGLRSQPMPFFVAVFRGYLTALRAVMSVDDPFEPTSNGGSI